jgi:hypothetical protein
MSNLGTSASNTYRPVTATNDEVSEDFARKASRPRVVRVLTEDDSNAGLETNSEAPLLRSSVAIALPLPSRPRARVAVLSHWEGTVIGLSSGEFEADLHDILSQKASYVATIPLEEVNESELALVGPGAIFDWVIGVRHHPWDQKETFSTLSFRRLPAWSRSDAREVMALRGRYEDLFGDE